MVSTRRQRASESASEKLLKTTPKKRGLFSVFKKKNKYAEMESEPETPPETPEAPAMAVTIMASEYDPSKPYGLEMQGTGISALTDNHAHTPRRVGRVGFATESPLEEKDPSPSLMTPAGVSAVSASDTEVTKDNTEAESMFSTTLGFFDDICQVPKPSETPLVDGANRSALAEWGTVPSEDEESTMPSLPSTMGESHSLDHTHSMVTTTTPATTANNKSVEVSQSQDCSTQPTLEKSPSHEHENFEVVLDTSQLSSVNDSPKRRGWLNSSKEDKAEPEAESKVKTSQSPGRKSLVKRLFGSGRKKKDEQIKEDLQEDGSETPMEEEEAQPEMATNEPERSLDIADEAEEVEDSAVVLESSPAVEPELEPAAEPAPEQTSEEQNAPAASDDVFNAFGLILSALDPTPVEEEKKDEEEVAGEHVEPAQSKADPYEEVGPDDEVAENSSEAQIQESVDGREPKEDDIEGSQVQDESAADKKLNSAKRGGLFGLFAKKAAKQSANNTKEETMAVARATDSEEPSPTEGDAEDKAEGAEKKPVWKTAIDEKTGKKYYYNRYTRESQYETPPSTPTPVRKKLSVAPVTTASAAPAPTLDRKKAKKVKPTWKAVVDPKSGKTYYYHRKTRETSWKMPDELKQLEKDKAEAEATPLDKNEEAKEEEIPAEPQVAESFKTPEPQQESEDVDPTPTDVGSPILPPMVVEAEMSEESQERITRGEQGILGCSFDEGEAPSEVGSIDALDSSWEKKKEIERLLNSLTPEDKAAAIESIDSYRGKEDLLLKDLRAKVESQPFDEPLVDLSSMSSGGLVSPPRLNTRSNTYMSKASATTRSSNITDKTERIKNTFKGRHQTIETISENQSTATSISSRHDEDYLYPTMNELSRGGDARIPSKVPVPRERELKVEELSSSRCAAETFDNRGRVVRSRASHSDVENTAGSYYDGDNEVDTYGTDSVSALSENDTDFSHRKENFEHARRRALDDAIEREDWDLAAALSEGMRDSNLTDGYAQAHTSWNQSDLDKFIANNDWDAVKRYIARMRADKGQGETPKRGTVVADDSNQVIPAPAARLSKRIGSKSQLQHRSVVSDSSWTSDSYDSEETSESDYS